MVVAMACTESWYHYLAVDIYSLLKTTQSVKKIYLLLETDDINDIPELKKVIEKYPIELKIINFNNMIDELIEKGNVNRDTKFSNFTFARLALPSIVEEDKVLYIDTDAIVLKDISELWNIDINNYYIAGCKDYGIFDLDQYRNTEYIFNYKYINAGIILMNLEKMRQNNLQSKFFNLIKINKYPLLDQDILNIICGDKKMYISSIYNYALNSTKKQDRKKIKIIHYAGEKKSWLKEKEDSELWYEIEKNFYNEFESER